MKRILSEFRLYFCNRWISGLPSHTIRLWFYRRIMKFGIGKGSYIMMDCKFDRTENFWMGNYSVINPNCRIDTRGGVLLGENVSISSDVIILTADHDMDRTDMKSRTKKVTIEDYVWIGTRATILPGVTIGRGAVVAAGALVTKDVSPLNVVAGVPAKVIRLRPDGFDYSASYKRLFQ